MRERIPVRLELRADFFADLATSRVTRMLVVHMTYSPVTRTTPVNGRLKVIVRFRAVTTPTAVSPSVLELTETRTSSRIGAAERPMLMTVERP